MLMYPALLCRPEGLRRYIDTIRQVRAGAGCQVASTAGCTAAGLAGAGVASVAQVQAAGRAFRALHDTWLRGWGYCPCSGYAEAGAQLLTAPY